MNLRSGDASDNASMNSMLSHINLNTSADLSIVEIDKKFKPADTLVRTTSQDTMLGCSG
jgi:hypothetical protein